MSMKSWTKSCYAHLLRWDYGRAIAPDGGVELMQRLHDRLSLQVPMEPLVLMNLSVAHPQHDRTTLLQCVALVFRGYDKETSLQLYRNFKMVNPSPRFSPDAHLVMTRAAMVEEYGIFGETLADAVSPHKQPYLHLLLHGKSIDTCTMREPYRIGFDVNVDDGQIAALRLFGTVQGSMEQPEVFTGGGLPYAEAKQIYHAAVGGDLDFIADINPLRNDYEKLAIAGLDVRPSDGTG